MEISWSKIKEFRIKFNNLINKKLTLEASWRRRFSLPFPVRLTFMPTVTRVRVIIYWFLHISLITIQKTNYWHWKTITVVTIWQWELSFLWDKINEDPANKLFEGFGWWSTPPHALDTNMCYLILSFHFFNWNLSIQWFNLKIGVPSPHWWFIPLQYQYPT